MRRWLLYHQLTMLDVIRLWPTVQHHVIIVAGICLPILLLLGLKNGHVADLREELLKSPTGRQVVFWSGQHGELMTPSAVSRYEAEMPGVDLIIPEVQRLVSLSSGGPQEGRRTIEDVTLYSTRPGDPILAQHGGDVLGGSERGIVLVRQVADALGVAPGKSVSVTVARQRDGISETVSIGLTVQAVVEQAEKEAGDVGYVDLSLLTAMEQYVLGFQVARLGWPAFKASAPDRYASYLIFCERASALTDEDKRTFRDRGYVVEAVEDENRRTLYGLLTPESRDKLLVYRVAARSTQGWQPLGIAPGEITRFTEADDVAIPWNEPRLAEIGGKTHHLVALSLPKTTWLKLYLKRYEYGFDYDAETLSVQFPDGASPSPGPTALKFDDGQTILLEIFHCGGPAAATDGQQADVADMDDKFMEKEGSRGDEEEKCRHSGGAPRETNEKEATHTESKNGGGSAAADFADGDSSAVSGVVPPSVSQEILREEGPVPEASLQPESPDSAPRIDPPEPADMRSETPIMTVDPGTAASVPPHDEDSGSSSPATGPSTESDSQTASAIADNAPPLAIVPMDLLAHLCAMEAGTVEFDPAIRLFVPVPREPLFDKARLYTNTIDDVPSAVGWLHDHGFAVMSEATRITEIHEQDHSLQLLVLIVGAGVFLFGTITVVSVLLDSTERKRGTLGILRVMGVSRLGVFYLVYCRATIIAVLAAGVTIGIGYGVSWFLAWQPPADLEWGDWKPVINVIIHAEDLLVVAAGSLACCGLGSLIPARKASRLDPFDAIIEGRFR